MPPDARLADAPHLQELHEPTPALRLVPRHVLQQSAPVGRAARLHAAAGLGGGAVLVHVALGAAFFLLLSFRDAELPREVEIPVEVVAEPPKPAASGAKAGAGLAAGQPGTTDARAGSGPPTPAKADPGRPEAAKAEPVSPEPAAAARVSPPPAPVPPARDARQPGAPAAAVPTPAAQPAPAPKTAPASKPVPAVPQPAGDPAAPKLVAPPPEAARAATRAKEDRTANRVPDEHQTDEATREARPAAVPGVLATSDAKAQSSVPAPAKAQAAPVDRPTPPTTAKVPSQADKLAAVLPMDPSGLPSPFRSVLAGNAAAQINAAYGGVVQGRIRQATVDLSAAAAAQQLRGAVAVRFTVDDAGQLAALDVVQSSGSAELDAMVVRAIRAIAPFPPPPSEAEHTFNKAFLVGG